MSEFAPDPGLRHRLQRVARRIADQHHTINDCYRVLAEKIDHHDERAARNEFNGYRGALAAHFELEERVFFPAVCCVDASQAEKIERLVATHAEMLTELGHLSDSIASLTTAEFTQRLTGFATILGAHERQEEALLHHAKKLLPASQNESKRSDDRHVG